MPIYAFRCAACNHAFDRLQKLSDPDPVRCPECGAESIERQLTAPSFRLAGSGWYETDFKKDGDRKRNLVGEDKADGDKTGESAKTETTKAEPATNSTPDTKPAETKPAATKPAETKPAAAKADSKPASKPD